MRFYSTNNKSERVDFRTAFLNGQASNYGLYMLSRRDFPHLSRRQIAGMRNMSYAEIAFQVLNPFTSQSIPPRDLESLLHDAYSEDKIPTVIQPLTGRTNIMWLTRGPTYSFKDYAARFFGRVLNYFLEKDGSKKLVFTATSGDTGPAVISALHGLPSITTVIFYPESATSEGQRRQMTTVGGNSYAISAKGGFGVCQALSKTLLGDTQFANDVFDDSNRFTSANSISIGRLLPQAVYPFFASSRLASDKEALIASIPSGNFGDMMGTVIAKQMGLPISKILCGVNENTEFPYFLETGRYIVNSLKESPSSAMMVEHPSNIARLIDFYGGHIFDERDPKTKRVIQEGVIDKMPSMSQMRRDIFSKGVTNPEHYEAMRRVFQDFGVIIDPHGAVGWKVLDDFLEGKHNQLAVIYETADPGKFPEEIKKATGINPPIPEGMQKQKNLPENIIRIESSPIESTSGAKLSEEQVKEAKEIIRAIFSK